MKENFARFVAVFTIFFMLIIMSGCSAQVRNFSDELTLNSWHTTFDNGNEISLTFDGDFATLTMQVSDNEKYEISGICECDDSSFIIYDSKYNIPYAFNYVVHYDRVELTYNKNTVSLEKV